MLFEDLSAFFQEYQYRGELDGGVESDRVSLVTERLRGRGLSLSALLLVLPLFFPPSVCGQEIGAALWGDLHYLVLTLWGDAKRIAFAPLDIGKVREVTLEQLLIAAVAVGSVGVMSPDMLGDLDHRTEQMSIRCPHNPRRCASVIRQKASISRSDRNIPIRASDSTTRHNAARAST